MRVFRGLEEAAAAQLREPVASVGVFDGVHRGHRQMLYELTVWAQSLGGTPCVVTFEHHPRATLEGVDIPMILTLEHRLLELERHGVEAVVLLDFARIQDLAAKDFLRDVLRDRLGCTHLLLGFDSHLGKGRDGTPTTLPVMGEQLGIEVRVASPVRDKDGAKIGSSSIRRAIQAGDLEGAANVLGRPVCLRGTVVHGAGRGTGMGVATANLDVSGQVLPPDGVYLVRVFLGSETAPAIANLGVQPTFGGGRRDVWKCMCPSGAGTCTGRRSRSGCCAESGRSGGLRPPRPSARRSRPTWPSWSDQWQRARSDVRNSPLAVR